MEQLEHLNYELEKVYAQRRKNKERNIYDDDLEQDIFELEKDIRLAHFLEDQE